MTNLEYIVVRQVHVLKEAAKTRTLTEEERRFLKRARPVLERILAREGS